MKILAISLLRLGDLLMLNPVLKGLKFQSDNVQLHVLINKQFLFVKDLFPWVDKFIALDRQQFQLGIGEVDRPIFEPMDRLDVLLNHLNKESFDRVINLTHNRFSGYLTGMINAHEKLGLTIQRQHSVSFGNRWYSYLNEQVAGGANLTAHLMDVHYYGSGLPSRYHHFDFHLSSSGETEVLSLRKNDKPFICVQPLTSDAKKNWSFQQWARALKFFKMVNSQIEIYCLGAPYEKERIEDFVKECEVHGVQVHPALCSLQGALALLNQARLLVTGDTSIKHLACGTDCKIIEISLGSSDFLRTGVYKTNSYIVTSTATCAPCPHSSSCSKSTHFCGDSLDTVAVGSLINHVLNHGDKEIKVIASEYNDKLKIYKTFFSHSGFWHARDLAKGFSSTDLMNALSLSSWKLLNQGEHLKLIGEYGSESVKLNAAIQQAFPEVLPQVKQRFYADIELQILRDGQNLKQIRELFQNISKNKKINAVEVQRNYKLLCEELSPALADEMISFANNYNGDPLMNFMHLRKYKEAMQNAFYRNQIQLKLLRTMMNQRMVSYEGW